MVKTIELPANARRLDIRNSAESIDDLRAKLVSLNESVEAIEALANSEGRELSKDESASIDEIFAEFRETERRLDREEQSRRPVGRITEPNPIGPQNRPHRDLGRQHVGRIASGADRSFAAMFGAHRANDLGGFRDSNEFLRAVHQNQYHPAFQAADMSEGVGADGGFLVPTRLLSRIFDAALADEIVRPRATVYPIMGSNSVSIAGVDYEDHSSKIGGLQGNWVAEAEANTRQAAKLRKVSLVLDKLAIYTRASSELAQDGLDFEMQLINAMRQAMSFDLDEGFIRGDGVAKPKGILNDPALVSVAKESGQAADTLKYQNVIGMWSRMHPACHSRAVWIVHPEAVPQLYSLILEGTSSSIPVYMPAGAGLTGSPSPTLMGRPVLLSEHASALGDRGDIMLVDLSQYAIAMRAEATLQRSIHESWVSDQVDFRLILRITGMGLWSQAITLRHGANTVSWCVTLDERA